MTLALALILPILLVASALASGSETALFSLTHADRLRITRRSPAAGNAIAALLHRPRMLLLTILLLNNFVNVSYFVIASVLSWRLAGHGLGIAVSIGSLLAIILGGEVFAKLLAARFKLPLCRMLAPPFLAVHAAIAPLRALLNAAVEPLMRLTAPGADTGPSVTPEELEALLEHHAGEGAIDEDERRVLTSVVALGARRVRDAMKPRIDIDWARDDMTERELLELIGQTRLTRIPICRRSPDTKVLGFVNIDSYFTRRDVGLSHPKALHRSIEPATFAPETARLDQLLELFRKTRTEVALCVDEQGGVSGLVEIETVVRSLLLADAPDTGPDDDPVRRLGTHTWSVPGRLSIRDWGTLIGPADPGDASRRISTVAGLVLARLGRVPRVGEAVSIGNLRLTIEAMDGLAIQRVRISVPHQPLRDTQGETP